MDPYHRNSSSFECDESLDCLDLSSDPTSAKPVNEYVLSMQKRERPLGVIDFSRHPELSAQMRAMLYDWMIKIAYDLCCKRQTLYLAMSYVDTVLVYSSDVKKRDFQVLGLSAMYVAAKAEEVYPPRVSQLTISNSPVFSVENIKATELQIMKAINWKLFPSTACNWLSYLMSEWDVFLRNYINNPQPDIFISFKAQNPHSYKRFRETFEILDLAQLDPQIGMFKPSSVAAALLYLMVNKYFKDTRFRLIRETIPSDEHMGEEAIIIHEIFADFASKIMMLQCIDVLQPETNFLVRFIEFSADELVPPPKGRIIPEGTEVICT